MSESFVDLSCRGLPLGRRIKLTQVRPSSGYLELAAPMPVGTAIVITTDEGPALEAIVTQVFEQIGGSERVPGMTVAPALAEDAGAAWWKARVSLPELAPTPPRSRPATVRPRSGTIPAPPAELVDDGKRTIAMAAVEPEPAEPEPADPEPIDPDAGAPIADDAPIVDDGKKTIMMPSMDLTALGLEAGASGLLAPARGEAAAAADDADDDDGDGGDGEGDDGGDSGDSGEDAEARPGANGDPGAAVPAAPTGVGDKKPHGKRRKKRR